MLGDYAKENPEQNKEVFGGIREVRDGKLGEHESEIEKIKTIFVSMLRDIKKDIEKTDMPKQIAGAEFLHQVMAEVLEQKPKSAEEVADIVANMVRNAACLDDNSTELYKRTIEEIIACSGKEC
jgi:hypothetical protein